MGGLLANAHLHALYSGPLLRQRQTAEVASEAAAAAGSGLPELQLVPELAEYQAFEMLKHMIPRLVGEDPKFSALESARTPRLLDEAFHAVLGRWARDEWTADGVERVGDFVARVRGGIDQLLRSAGSGARLACVTSAGPIGVAVGLVFGAAVERMVRTSVMIRNASITELRFRTGGFDWRPEQLSLVTFNATHHLSTELHTER